MDDVIRILVVDDHPIVRDGLVMILNTQPDFHVVGEADNGTDCLAKIEALAPEIVLLDLEIPEPDGIAVIKALSATHPHIRVLVFTAFDTDDQIINAVQAGAQGYLLKGVPRDEIFHAIRVIHQGGSLLQPVVASKLIRSMVHSSHSPEFEALSEREMDVLKLLAQGSTNREIAESLVITERTVKFHVTSILNKLSAANRTEAVSIAVQQGLIDLNT